MNKLLTREEFKEYVFKRDKYICIEPDCFKKAVDAHHIIERALWTDGGYYLNNGASLCEEHHKQAELDIISPQVLRYWLNVEPILPGILLPNEFHNKYGEPYTINTKNDTRSFNVNDLRISGIKYPTTYYLPFSPIPSEHEKDIFMRKHLIKKPLVITKKMDGSNLKINSKQVTARNGLTAEHKSFDMVKGMHARIKYLIPKKLDIFGEWLYAKHSIHYKAIITLQHLFQIFAVYDREKHIWLGWHEVESLANHLGFPTVPVVDNNFCCDNKHEQLAKIIKLATEVIKQGHEGIVVRNKYSFHMCQFTHNVAKFVRENHVQTDKHWMSQKIIKNEVKDE